MAILLTGVATGCLGPRETALEPMPDVIDRPASASSGNAPRKTHPRGVTLELSASFVEHDLESKRREFQVTLEADNRSAAEVRLPYRDWWLQDDTGTRYRSESVLLWNEETEEYEPAPNAIATGATPTLVVQFPVGRRLKLAHLIRVTLHWQYSHGGRNHRVATRFRVP